MLESETMFTYRITGKINIALFHCRCISNYRMKKMNTCIFFQISQDIYLIIFGKNVVSFLTNPTVK